ncbi:MAG: HEAT repeat domain-containing protein, partial [Gemmatimonadota bacterium]|nr:HEAT repeat domain-containing protein [Gemmatimonadota bacterium]
AAQSIEGRVAAAPDGIVRMSYATRAGVCGDARDAVAMGKALYIWPSMESHGTWSGVRCVAGPARVEFTKRGREITSARTRVGGTWSSTDERVTDLGVVPAREAGAYMVSLAGIVEATRPAREMLLAAAIADSGDVAPAMWKLARDAGRPRETRRRAIFWYGTLGDAGAASNLSAMAQDANEDRGTREAAIGALSQMADNAGVTALISIANKSDDVTLRGKAAFWLGQSDDPRGRTTLRAMITSDDTPDKVKEEAIFALGQNDPPPEDVQFLERAYKGFTSEKLKEKVFFSIAQTKDDRGMRWLLDVGRDAKESVQARNQALFWAGQSGVSLADLTKTYDAIDERRVKEHLIFVLSQRSEPEAVDKLMAIARTDADREMRKKALFWLGQKNDPRVTKMLTDMISR